MFVTTYFINWMLSRVNPRVNLNFKLQLEKKNPILRLVIEGGIGCMIGNFFV